MLTLATNLSPEEPKITTSDNPCVCMDQRRVNNVAVIRKEPAISTYVHTSVQNITHHPNLFTRHPPPPPSTGLNAAAKIHTCNMTWSGVDRQNKSTALKIFNIWSATPDHMAAEHDYN
jgi:hypothetical protein